MSIKTAPFFLSDFLLYHYSNLCYYTSLLHYGKFEKNSGENENNVRAKYPKNHENFKNNKPGVQFNWFFLINSVDIFEHSVLSFPNSQNSY